MKALATALLALVTACGEGRVILNVDVLSFLPASDSTKPYNFLPGITTPDTPIVVRQFALPPGFGSSSVDSLSATLTSQIENQTGGGKVVLSVFFATTQGALFTGTPYLRDSATVSGTQTVPLGSNRLSLSDTVFNSSDVWLGIRARLTTNAGVNMSGRIRFTDLRVRAVLQDKVF